MEDNAAVIRYADKPRAQIQIIDGKDGRRVQLYSLDGVMLCETPFTGDNDAGFAMGNALYVGYSKGWENCDYVMYRTVLDAMSNASGGLKL